MKRAFFLGKQIVQTKAYSTAIPVDRKSAFLELLNSLSFEGQKEVAQTCYKQSFAEIQKHIQKGNELIATRANRDPLKSLEEFKESAKLADKVLESMATESLSEQYKLTLAQAYASYADILKKVSPLEIDMRKEMVKKALELDPMNEAAGRLDFDMNFYDRFPDPQKQP